MENPEFTNDMQSLLRPDITFDASDAYPLIYETFIDKMEEREIRLILHYYFFHYIQCFKYLL
jgi:hypothetical protein